MNWIKVFYCHLHRSAIPRLQAQSVNSDVVVLALPAPAAAGSAGIDGQAARRVERRKLPGAAWQGADFCKGAVFCEDAELWTVV